MFGNLFGGIQAAQIPQPPFGCTGSCEGTVLASGVPALNQALAVLSGVVGTYAFIEQIKLQKRMVRLAERTHDRADEYYDTAKTSYDTVSTPTWQRMRDLYDRYVTFRPREDSFINCAYGLREYCPDVVAESRRVTGQVSTFFSRANAHRQRMAGRACTKVACHHTTHMAVTMALMQSSAASAALQYEEDRKRELDQWYWQRWKDGAAFILALGDRGVKAILAGAENVARGLQGISSATTMYQQASAGQAGALANAAQFWGNIASGGLNGFGQAVGAGYFNSTASAPAATSSGWTTTVVPAAPSSGYTSFK